MGRKALLVEDQIELLKSRGLIIEDEAKAEELLLDIGYYRLGFYWHYFQNPVTHKFQKGISLDDIVKLYYFDFDLKNLLSRYIYRIEVHFRTQVVYHVSNYYSDDPTWYVDSAKVNHHILKDFNSIYYNLKNYNNVIERHHTKYRNDRYAPAWKTFEFLTFGQIYKIYSNLKKIDSNKKINLKGNISKVYGIRDPEMLDNFFKAIINIRNICSHNAVLYDFNQPKPIRRIPHAYYRNKTTNNTSLNASLRLILFILSKISINRAKELEKGIVELFNNMKSNDKVYKVVQANVKLDLQIK